MRRVLTLLLSMAATAGLAAEAPQDAYTVTSVSLPGAPATGVSLDYLAIDRARGRVWVPAAGTGSVAVLDAKTGSVSRVEGFATQEIERNGTKRSVGPSSATVGDGVVYVGNRGDASVCAVDAASLAKLGCVTLPGSPDGVVYAAKTKEVWVTTPRDQSIVVLDVSNAKAPKVAGSFKLEGDPEGYAVDDAHGVFFTNLEDKDKTLRIDLATRKVTATWAPGCGEAGPRGLVIDPGGRVLVVACTDHLTTLDAAGDGKVLGRLETGEGVDNLDYVPKTHRIYAAAGRAGTLTVATLDAKGQLTRAAKATTAKGARNAVASDDDVVFIADGPEGKVLIARPARAH
jgi:DNA-binding beta-propeller fold protein YncE